MGFEAIMSADEWPQTYALDRAATGTDRLVFIIAEKLFSERYELNLIQVAYFDLQKVTCRFVLAITRSWNSISLQIKNTIYNSSLLSWREETL
jgi:hypothetical protein